MQDIASLLTTREYLACMYANSLYEKPEEKELREELSKEIDKIDTLIAILFAK